MAEELRLAFLGGLQITRGGVPVEGSVSSKAQALLCYLAVTGRPHLRPAMAGLLWGEMPEASASANLRQALSNLRRLVGPHLTITRQTVVFDRESPYWSDVEAFRQQASEVLRRRDRSPPPEIVAALAEAIRLYRGDFLAGFYVRDAPAFEEWALVQRERLRELALQALHTLATHHAARGENAAAMDYTARLLALDPWREEAHRQMMALLARNGRRSAALAQYETCRRVLAEELGIEPMAETTALYERIRAAARRPNLPPQPTPFVGREDELADIARRLADPACRLLTLVGPAGIGKTRLALQSAARSGAFLDGVYFVPLASVASPRFLIPAVADALRLSFYGRESPTDQLLSYLREKEILLVMDNFEHLLEGAELVSDILQRAPRVKILATSRQRLNLRWEWLFDVQGLAFPEGDEDEKVNGVEDHSAVQLFAQSAARVYPGFSLAEEKPCVVRICRLVEGMPLGIELAAAWVRTRPCQEIVREIEHNLDLLATGLRDVPERQRSVRAAFEHSWRFLSEAEQHTLRKLSVFQGGFGREAAKQVAGASQPVLAALVDKSLLREVPPGRYEMLRVLGQYAAQKLGQFPQEQQRVQALHSSYYADFLRRRAGALKGEKQGEALEEIGVEIDNVRRAWRWALTQIENGQDEALAMAVIRQSMESLYLFYTTRDRYQEGEEALSRAATVLGGPGQPTGIPAGEKDLLWGQLLARQGKCCEFTAHSDKAQRLFERSLEVFHRLGAWRETALPLHGLGYVAHIRGEYAQAEAYYQKNLAIYRRSGDSWGVANVLNNMCMAARRQGAFPEAKRRCQESLAIRREIGDRRGVAASLNNLGLIHCALGEYAEAREVLQEGLQICRQIDHKIGIANALTGLCQAAFRLGEVEAAEQFGQESLALYRDIGDHWGVAIAFNNLGRMAVEVGDYARAKRLYQEGIAVYHQIGIRSGLANTLSNLGEACCHLGQYTAARQYLHQALQIAQEIGAIPTALKTVVGLAPLLAQEGETVHSLELLAFAMHRPAIVQAIREKAAVLFSELAAGLSPEAVAAAEARGQARQLDAVVAEVLRDQGTGT